MDYKLEVVVVPVSDVDRAKAFYGDQCGFPIDLDTTTYGDKVALRPQDMLPSPAVSQITLVFRGVREPAKFADLSGSDLVVYCQ